MIAQMKKLNEVKLVTDNKLAVAETYFLLFLAGSIVGWIYELFFYWIFENRISNNGFFYGSYLPIYGFGTFIYRFVYQTLQKAPDCYFLIKYSDNRNS